MKKLLLMSGLVLVFSLFVNVSLFAAEDTRLSPGSKPQQEKPSRSGKMLENAGWAALMYIPNRIIDATDIFTLQAGAGGAFAVDVHVTKYFQIGGWHGPSYFLEKGYARQYGGGNKSGSAFGILCFDYNETFVTETFGTVREYYIEKDEFGMADFMLDPYMSDDADFWAIGFNGGWLLNFAANVHPIEIADFVTGIFFIDLMNDDL